MTYFKRSLKLRAALVATVLSMMTATQAAWATQYTWKGGSSLLWSIASNWSPQGIPGLGDSAIVGDGKTVLLSLDVIVTDLTLGTGATLQGLPALTVAGTFTNNGANLDGLGLVTILPSGLLNYNGGANPRARGTRPVVNSGRIDIRSGTMVVGTTLTQTAGNLRLSGGNVKVNGLLGLKGLVEILGGSVSGIGTIDSHVSNSAQIAPGFSPGTITINGNYTQTSSGRLDVEVGGTNPGTGYDQLIVKGTASLGGTINLIRWNNYLPPLNSSYKFITYYSVAGGFTTFNGLYPSSDRCYKITKAPSYFLGNVSSTSTRSVSRLMAQRSRVQLSIATATSSTRSVRLAFSGALEPVSAQNISHYTVQVNGQSVPADEAVYEGSSNSVTLLLPEGSLSAGATVAVEWKSVLDAGGRPVEGHVGSLLAR
jgi:hypothetical protein